MLCALGHDKIIGRSSAGGGLAVVAAADGRIDDLEVEVRFTFALPSIWRRGILDIPASSRHSRTIFARPHRSSAWQGDDVEAAPEGCFLRLRPIRLYLWAMLATPGSVFSDCSI